MGSVQNLARTSSVTSDVANLGNAASPASSKSQGIRLSKSESSLPAAAIPQMPPVKTGVSIEDQLNLIFTNNKESWPDGFIKELSTLTGITEDGLKTGLDSIRQNRQPLAATKADDNKPASDTQKIYTELGTHEGRALLRGALEPKVDQASGSQNDTSDSGSVNSFVTARQDDADTVPVTLEDVSRLRANVEQKRDEVLAAIARTKESAAKRNKAQSALINAVKQLSPGSPGPTAEKVLQVASFWKDKASDTKELSDLTKGVATYLNEQQDTLDQLLKVDVSNLPENEQVKLKAAIFETQGDINFLKGFSELSEAQSKGPLLDMDVMGGRIVQGNEPKESVRNQTGATFLDTLKGSSVGAANHGLERALWIRSEMNGLLDTLDRGKTAKTSRDDIIKLAVALDDENADKLKEVLGLFQTNENFRGYNLGSYNINRVAAMNLIAAGYNPKTLELDAPSLDYKAKEVGFSALTKVLSVASKSCGKTTRTPEKHIVPRLEALDGMQQALKDKLYPEGQKAVVEHLLNNNASLTEFGALMIASMPRDFLILHPVFVQEIKALTEKCKVDGKDFENFQANKKAFENIHSDVSKALNEHQSRNEADRIKHVEISNQMVIEVHRRGHIKKAVSSIGRSFMQNIGAPLGGVKRAVGEFWKSSSAGVRFKAALADSRDKSPVPGLLLAIMKADELSETEKTEFKNFLSGKSETLNLRNVDAKCLSLSRWNAFKTHVDKTWESAAPGVPKPTNLVSYPNGLPAEFYLPPGVVLDSAEKKDDSRLLTAGAALTKTASASVSANATNRVMAKVSGEGNRCWLRAANAAALEYAGVDAVSEKVFQKLAGLQSTWNDPEKNTDFAKFVPSDYEFYMPENQEEVAELYKALENARDKEFKLADAQETKLQKITLQLALSELDVKSQLESKLKQDDVWNNFNELLSFNEKQGDVSIVIGFLVNGLGMPLLVTTDTDPEGALYTPEPPRSPLLPRDVDGPGKRADSPLIRHRGSIDSGHFDFARNTTEPKPTQA